jgi:hypothetical protein
LGRHLRFLKDVIGVDSVKTSDCNIKQTDVATAIKNYLVSNNIGVVYYKGGLFEKHLIDGLKLNIDIIDIEKYPYCVPPTRLISLNFNTEDFIKCLIHNTNGLHHCAIKDIFSYYYYIKCSHHLHPLWPDLTSVRYLLFK